MGDSQGRQRQARALARLHLTLTIAWLLVIPIAVLFGLLESVAFISAISIYANVSGHFSAWQAARAEEAVERNGGD